MAALGEARPGYELWHPNRESATAKTTKAVVTIILLISAALLIIVTLGGWERLQSTSIGLWTLVWAGLYIFMAFLVFTRWQRGLLPVASALSVLMVIFASVSAPGWFERAKDGLNSPALPEELLGLLTVLLIPVQLLLVGVTLVAFNQEWNVEEERPIGGGSEPGDPVGADEELEPIEEAPPAPEGSPQSWPPPEAGAAPTS